MTTSVGVGGSLSVRGETVCFGEHFAASEQFDSTFKEGMRLVERTAAYLDGQGRHEAKSLVPRAAVLYATESMRLTTRLLELASWLLIHRSLKLGEISVDEAQRKRRRIRLKTLGRPAHINGFHELPEALRDLIIESVSLTDRIAKLDSVMNRETAVEQATPADNPVGAQLARLSLAFERT